MSYYISVPDNESQFFVFVNLVINNKGNNNLPNYPDQRPKKIGPYKVTYTNNEVNEPFIEVYQLKEKAFIEMIIDQFTLLRTYLPEFESYEKCQNSDKYGI